MSPVGLARRAFLRRGMAPVGATPVNETIDKLTKQAEQHRADMKAAFSAAEKEGVSDDDKKKHLAEFDAAEAKLKDTNDSLERATRIRDAEQAATKRAEHEREPDRKPLATRLHNPYQSSGGIPASAKRYGSLKAFKGKDAEELAYQAGLWVAATMYGHTPSRQSYQERYGEINAVLSTVNNSGAAYFVPDVVETSVIELVEQFGVFRRYAELVPMASDTQTEPRWTGGQPAYFVSEGQAPTESDPSWDKVGLTAKNLACFGKMSRNLNEDAIINLGDKWAMAAAVSFAEKEDDCGFNGDGTSTYGNIAGLRTKVIDSANAASLHTATGEATLGALTVGTFESVIGKLPEYPGISPVWFCHKEVFHASMGRLKRTAGGVSMQEMTEGGTPTYAGYPVVFSQKMPKAASVTTGVTGILFGDLSMAAKFGDRRGRTFETGLDGNDFSKQLLSMLCTERFDINCHTIVDPRNSSNAGPIIGLKLG